MNNFMKTEGKVLIVGGDTEICSKGYNLYRQGEKIGVIKDKKYACYHNLKSLVVFFVQKSQEHMC